MYIYIYTFVVEKNDASQNRSDVHLPDLPDNILLIILKKLNNSNEQLNILPQEKIFSNILNFVSIDNISSIDRFCIDILPRIHDNMKYFILKPVLMKRILLAADYPNLLNSKFLISKKKSFCIILQVSAITKEE
jgi:hypothetical protein